LPQKQVSLLINMTLIRLKKALALRASGTFLFLFLVTSLSGSAKIDSLKQEKVTIAAVGDIMFGTSYPSEKYLPPHDNPLLLMGSLSDTLSGADITFGNLEGSFLNQGEPAKLCRDSLKCYLFRMPERYAGALKKSGFDVLSLANNHSGDFGTAGRRRTMELLDSLEIFYGGLIEFPGLIFEKDSVTYGFTAFSPNAGTLNINDISEAEMIVKDMSDKCDIMIISFHGGAEGADYQRIPEGIEMFYGESRGDVREFSHRMIEAGADLVFGHGPHVTRAVEIYKDRFIAYSLGNFCTYGRFNLSGPNGTAPIIMVDTDKTGRFISGRIVPVKQSWDAGVRFDPSKKAISTIRNLVELDFPGSVTVISGSGTITKKM